MKRKSVCWFLCFALCFCFASCQRTRRQEEGAPPAPADEARLGTDSSVTPLGVCVFSESEQKRSKSFHKVIARLAYPVVGLAEEDAARYPALAQALNRLNGQIAGSAKARYAAVAEAAAADIGAAPDSFTEYESTTRLFVRRADTRILSLLYESYTFAGGGEGSRIWSAISFDAASGRELSLAGLVPDISALSSVVRELLLKHYPKTKFYELTELDSRFGEGDGDFCWLADDAGLTFVFNPNDIAPAADGSIAVTVPYGALSGAVSAEYAALPGASAVALPPELPYFGDLDGDGETDRLTVSCEKDEYGAYYDMLCVSFNDGKTLEDTLACGVDALLFHASDGRCFLYLEELLDNSYKQIAVCGFSGGKAEKLDTVVGGFGRAVSETDALGLLPTNPCRFILENRTELLSTADGRRVCRLGKNGLPEPEDERYTLVQPVRLRLLHELPVKTLGTDGSETGETTLSAGTELDYIRTDGERTADLRLADGGEVRVEVGKSDWGFTVAGFDVREIFDGVRYG